MKLFKLQTLFYLLIILVSCSTIPEVSDKDKFEDKVLTLDQFLDSIKITYKLPKNTKLERYDIDTINKNVTINLSKEIAVLPFRESLVDTLYRSFKDFIGVDFLDYNFSINSLDLPIEELIPNFYRSDKQDIDRSRLPKKNNDRTPLVQNLNKPIKPIKGLTGKNILLWHSHGWYYNNDEKRWMWQRARLFQTVEDIGPISFTLPYLIPMLENAGANVFIPRERDIQSNEVIIDNDNSNKEFYNEKIFSGNSTWQTSTKKGFALKNPTVKEGENPFTSGTNRFIKSMINPFATVSWQPDFPESGDYAVYISYSSFDSSVSDARYKVIHSAGETEFLVNQQIGGGTWVYLGTFNFVKGRMKNQGVVLSNQSKDVSKIVSADAVRFGGGMGIVEREGLTSGRPKFVEGARYWLQFAGMPDTLVYNLNNYTDDYKDDYQCRAEFGNYLYGNPFGPNRNKIEKGLGIPIDLSLAFHTDAGITRNDTAIGTLMIYSIPGLDSQKVFPDGVSRLANRDLSDIVQTQIVDDIRDLYDSTWTRRQLMNALYSEASRPNFPSMLLELLSHQNFYEMKFALDPRFRFDISRSIYKGMLKFLSVQYGFEYVIQPLPPSKFTLQLNNNGILNLSWKAQVDSLEPSAGAEKFILYTRINNGGFDNGRLFETDRISLSDLKPGMIYSYKVTAVNNGGESFPTEILSVCYIPGAGNPVLIVNGFDRVCAPSSFDSPTFSGFTNFIDEGVPYKYDLGFTGTQFNFNPDSKWLTDDNPGHGASHSDFESKIISGNNFDYSYVHGSAIKDNGLSFCSVSDEAVINGDVDLTNYRFIDFILGEEKKTPNPKYRDVIDFEAFPVSLRDKITSYLTGGGKLFVSGSYIGSDLYSDRDSTGIVFANEILKFKLKTGWAVKTGKVFSVSDTFLSIKNSLEFNTAFNDSLYKVEAPDELGNVKDSEVLIRYSENNFSAGVGYKDKYGVVALGFPFETILGEKQRSLFMKSVLKYLEVK